MKQLLVGIILILGLSRFGTVSAEMSSTNYRIRADSISAGGDNTSSSASYILRDSVGQNAQGIGTSSSYRLDAGFRGVVFDQVVALSIGVEESGAYTTVSSRSGTSIVVASAGSFSVGDLVVLVEDDSTTHNAGAGEIMSISGTTIVVDQIASSSTVTIDGTDDRLYRANGSSIAFGNISSSSIFHSDIVWRATADTPNGFSVYVREDGDLRSGLNSIADVSDGTVTTGAGEYGARSSDTTLSESTFDTQDTAITSELTQVGSVSGTAFASKGLLDLKVSPLLGATQTTYAQQLSLAVVPIY